MPAANDERPTAKSGRLSLKPTKRIADSANCIEIPKPMMNKQIKLMIIECDNQNALKPIN